MSKVEIEIPDDRWFRGEWGFRPRDSQMCVVVLAEKGMRMVDTMRYNADKDGFYDYIKGTHLPRDSVIMWKPINVDERMITGEDDEL